MATYTVPKLKVNNNNGDEYVVDPLSYLGAATQSANGLMSSTDKTKLDGIATGATANTGTITGITMNGVSKGTSGVVDLGTVITSHQDISGKVDGPATSTDAHVAVFNGTGGKTIKDSGFTIGKSVPSDAVFTDNDTKNTAGTTNKTGTKMYLAAATSQAVNPQTYSNSNCYIGTDNCLYSGGTKVLTAHQDIRGKKNTQSAVSDPTASGNSLTFIATISQNAQGVISPTKKTVTTMTGATSSTDGTAGLAPAATSANRAKFLRGDATWQTPTNTKNTAGATDSSSKLFLVGATEQTANPQTYTQDTAYVGTDGCLYSNSKKVVTKSTSDVTSSVTLGSKVDTSQTQNAVISQEGVTVYIGLKLKNGITTGTVLVSGLDTIGLPKSVAIGSLYNVSDGKPVNGSAWVEQSGKLTYYGDTTSGATYIALTYLVRQK